MFHQRGFVFHSPWSERRVGKHTFFNLKKQKDGKKGYFSATEMEGENKHFMNLMQRLMTSYVNMLVVVLDKYF